MSMLQIGLLGVAGHYLQYSLREEKQNTGFIYVRESALSSFWAF